jgi:uncharacterized protein (TIGR02391 family)
MEEPKLTEGVLKQISQIIGDTGCGLTGSEIGYYLQQAGIKDVSPQLTKWKRLFDAFATYQNEFHCSNAILYFCKLYFQPANFVNKDSNLFEEQRGKFNRAVSFAGLNMTPAGELRRVDKATTISDAQNKADDLRQELRNRNTHQYVFKYCTPELLANDYFHAVEEAIKGLFDRIREISVTCTDDGSSLIDKVFSSSDPMVIINNFRNESEKSEHKGFSTMLKALYSMFRNPTAHSPKIKWGMDKIDALDIFGMVSLCHRKLDNAQRIK